MAQARLQAVRAVALAVLLLGVLPLGGCWDSIELNDRGIVAAIGLDRQDGTYQIWAQVLQPIQIGGGPGQHGPLIPTIELHGSGPSVEEAARDMQLHFTPRLYYGHLQIILIQERLAKEGIRPVIEWMNQSLDRRLSQILLITRSALPEIMKITSPQALRSNDVVRESMGSKIGRSSTLGAWAEELDEAGVEPILGIYAPVKKNGKVVRQDESDFEGMALFRQDRMVGFLPAPDSVPFLLLNGDLMAGPAVQASFIDHGHVPVAITWRDTHVKRRVDLQGGKLRYVVDVVVRGRLSQPAPGLDPYDMKDVRKVEASLAAAMATRMRDVFAKIQEMHVDAVGVGRLVHAQNSAYWSKVRANWNDQFFPKVELVVTPKVQIIDEGLIRTHFRANPNQVEPFGAKPRTEKK